MLGVLRAVVMLFLVLTVFYVCLSLYSRSVRKEKLEREWDEEVRKGDRDAFVRAGLEEYRHSLRRKLILGVYIVPLILAVGILYIVNFM